MLVTLSVVPLKVVNRMTDKQLVKMIAKMSSIQLLGFVLTNPQYISDSYYKCFAIAIEDRYYELEQLNNG